MANFREQRLFLMPLSMSLKSCSNNFLAPLTEAVHSFGTLFVITQKILNESCEMGPVPFLTSNCIQFVNPRSGQGFVVIA